MLQWFMENMGAIAVCLVLALMVAGAVLVLVRDKKKGKSSCGGNCGHCAMSGSCHKQ